MIDPSKGTELIAPVRAITPDGVRYAYNTTGVPSVHTAVVGALAPKGMFGLVGIAPPQTNMPSDVIRS